MSVTSVDKDLDSLTLTLVADVDARRLWADPRQLDRWRGPPTQSGDLRAARVTPAVTSRTS
jgi:hypothetical protein